MREETKHLIRSVGAILFLLYLAALAYVLFFSEGYGRVPADSIRYNVHPFAEIKRFWIYREIVGRSAFVVNVFGNIGAFLPFGFFLPLLFSRMNQGLFTPFAGFLFSLSVEMIQLITRVGTFDVDDIILNTIGAVLGFYMFKIADGVRRKWYG